MTADAARRAEDEARIRALPCWRGRVDSEPLAGGLTNRNYLVRDGLARFVVRMVGADLPRHGISRAHELAATRAAFEAGIGPELVHAEPGLLVIRHIAGTTLDAARIREPATVDRIADLLATSHRETARHLRGPAPCFWIFHTLRHYLRQIAESGGDPGRCAADLAAVDDLEKATGPVRVAFAHNDLLAANLIDDERRLWLIDWEYAGFGAALFDLAGLSTLNELDDDLRARLRTRYRRGAPEDSPPGAFAAMCAAAALRESLWGDVQRLSSDLPVDFAAYAAEHRARFEAERRRVAAASAR